MRVTRAFGVLAVTASLFLAACQSSASESPSASTGGSTEPSAPASEVSYEPASVRLQLQWTDQAQFAGYYAAVQQGYYEDVGLTVDILPGGGTIVPQQVGSATDGPEFTIAWMPKVLEARQAGSDLVHLAQVFQRSATLSVTWADSGIEEVSDWEGKRIGAWPFGNELEVLATAQLLADLAPPDDFTRVEQDFDMNELIAAQDGRDGALPIYQKADLYNAVLDPGASVTHVAALGRKHWVQVGKGAVEVNGVLLKDGDGAAITGERTLTIQATESSEVMLFDMA